jgi:hypothetical protein
MPTVPAPRAATPGWEHGNGSRADPRGHNEEGWSDGRYGVYNELEAWRVFVSSAAFFELTHYYRATGLPRERQSWLASVWRR